MRGAYVNKWATLALGVLLEIVSGLQYGFSVYSEALKKNHGLSQQQAQLIGTVINSSNYLCGILAGCTFDALARFPRIGPRICCAIALVLAGLGYPLLWALAADRIHVSGGASSATCAIAGAAFVASLSGPFCDSVAMAVGVNNFPAHRGQVVGQLKSFVGLSASLHLAVYSAIPHSTASDFILLQVCSAVLASALGVAGQNMVHFKQPDELSDPASVGRKLIVTFAWGTSIAIAVAGVNLLPQGAETHHRTHTMAAGTIVVALVAQLLWTALSSGPLLLQKGAEEPLLGPDESLGDSDARVHSIMEREDAPADEPGTSASEEEKALLEEASADVSLLQAWATVDLWLIYAIVSIGTGAGLSLNNNFAQMVLSYGGEEGGQMVFVALYSVSSCFARSLFGELSQQALVRADIPRPAFLAISAGLTATASLVAATGSLPLLYIASMVGGFAFGSYWVLMPAIISEVFGTRFFATIYGFTASSPALGALLLSNLLVARAYDNMGKKHGDPEGTCFGPDCYQSPFLCIAALSTVSIAFSLLVAARARQRYSAIHAWLAGQGM